MEDNRKFYETKTFWGFVLLASGLVTQSFGLVRISELLLYTGSLWTGYSIVDRLRK